MIYLLIIGWLLSDLTKSPPHIALLTVFSFIVVLINIY